MGNAVDCIRAMKPRGEERTWLSPGRSWQYPCRAGEEEREDQCEAVT